MQKERQEVLRNADWFPKLPSLEDWDRLLGLCDLTSKDMSHSNPMNKQVKLTM